MASLTLIGPAVFMGRVNSSTILEWAYVIGPVVDGVGLKNSEI